MQIDFIVRILSDDVGPSRHQRGWRCLGMSYLRSRPELLARFRSGERVALAEVYRTYLPQLQGALTRGFALHGSDRRVAAAATRADLADAIQEVFSRAFAPEARTAYDATRDYAPYLFVIARNVMITRHRKRARAGQRGSAGARREPRDRAGEWRPGRPFLARRARAGDRAALRREPGGAAANLVRGALRRSAVPGRCGARSRRVARPGAHDGG